MSLREKILKKAYKIYKFSLTGSLESKNITCRYKISCVINFYGRTELLRGILTSLCEQKMDKDKFEVLLIEDRGGTEKGKKIADEYSPVLTIKYKPLRENFGTMGYARNYGISESRGEYILFLDDDTVIMEHDFLERLIEEFGSSDADGIMPYGSASYCIVDGKYSFHDPYFPTNRCMAYKREVLSELGGFVSEIIGQEDVEFVVRFTAAGKTLHRSNVLNYMHPPLILPNANKAAAVGLSFAKLKCRYPLIVWLMLLLNGLRYLPLALFPLSTKHKMQSRFSIGFLIGIWYAAFGKTIEYK